jgi:hypothetical protein
MVVFVLLSSEYPIVLTDWDEQVAAVAERVNGDETLAPLTGLLTTTLAAAGIERVASRRKARENFWDIIIFWDIIKKYLHVLELIGSILAWGMSRFKTSREVLRVLPHRTPDYLQPH